MGLKALTSTGGGNGSNGSPTYTLRIVTAAGAVTLTSADGIVEVNKTVGAATTVNLPSSPVIGQIQYVKDAKGDAAVNNITLTPPSGNIDGSSTLVIDSNYGSRGFCWDGTNFSVVA